MSSFPAARLRPTDWLRRERYVFKVEWLSQDVPGGYRKEMRRELRSDLAAAAADVGMSQAVRDLGPASVLAHQLKEAEGRKLPHVWTGMITFTVILYAWTGMIMSTMWGMTEAAEQLGGGRTVTVHANWFGTTLRTSLDSTVGRHVLSGGVTFSTPTLVVFVVISLLAARAWRYRPAWLQRRLAANLRAESSR